MKLEFSNDHVSMVECDALLVGRFKGGALSSGLDDVLGDVASDLLNDMKGADQVALFYPLGLIAARRLLVVGLGEEEKLTLETIRRAAAKGLAKANALGVKSVATTLGTHSGEGFDQAEATGAVVEGAQLALYEYSLKKPSDDEEDEKAEVEKLLLLGADEAAQGAARLAQAIASGVIQARDLVNAPPNIANAPYLAEVANDIAASNPHIKATILSLEQAREMGMGAFAAVAQGSATPAHFIVLEHRVKELSEQQPVGLVGKGLIFDTGGISLKPASNLWKMKGDMSGGAAVLGAFRALANLPEPLDVPVVGVVPATDNAVGYASFTPADVLTALNGKTIEIQNTDAEGRLILADALTYVDRYKPRAVVDLATLTGSIVTALGHNMSGLFCNNDELAQRLQQAATQSGEEVWRMPLHDDYEKLISSTIANVKNIGGRPGGSITAALFLRHFIGDYAWAHLDIAGGVWGEDRAKKLPYNKEGASGVGVRLLMQWLQGYASKE